MKDTYTNYIFDLYGTLVDIWTNEKAYAFWQSFSFFLTQYGKEVKPFTLRNAYLSLVHQKEEEMRREKGYDLIEIDIRDVFKDLLEPIKVDEEEMQKICTSFRRLSLKRLKAYENTIEVLEYLKKRGKKIYLLSNAQSSFSMQELMDTGVLPYFDAIYISSVYGMKKPHPQFMEVLLKEQGLNKEECVMIGNDLRSDILIAQLWDMDSIYLNTFHLSAQRKARQMKVYRKIADIRVYDDGDILHVKEFV